MKLRNIIIGAAAVAALSSCDGGAVVLAACAPVAPPPAPAAHRVVMVGDSITADSADAIRAAIPGVYVDARPGRGPDGNLFGAPFPNLREAIRSVAPAVAPGGFLVVQDDGGFTITAEFVAWVAAQLPDDRTLVWVSPSNDQAERGDLSSSTANVRDGIAAQPAHVYLDWYGLTGSMPWLLADGLHPGFEGQLALAELVRSAVG